MAVRIITNRSSLAGSAARDSAARDAAAREAGESQSRSGGVGFSMRGPGGKATSTPVRPATPVAAEARPGFPGQPGGNDGAGTPDLVKQQAAHPAETQQPGEVTSAAGRFKQMFRTWFR